MTDRELKHMNRSELLQLLLTQMEENESLRAQLKEAKAQLENRRLVCENAGSIAEAALQLSGVFEAADRSAKQYLQNIELMHERQKSLYDRAEQEARSRANAIMAEADAYRKKAKADADAYWQYVRGQVQSSLTDRIGIQPPKKTAGRK